MGRLISDGMSYRNHYMCSGEATSFHYNKVTLTKCLTTKIKGGGDKMRTFVTLICSWSKPYLELSDFAEN